MTPLDLAVGEFGLSDKIQPYEHIQGRLNALRKAYAVHPEIAREVISYAWPHAQNRPWTHDELHERLGLQPQQIAEKAASVFLKSAAAQFVQQYFPAFGAAFDAFEATRAQQEALDAERQRVAYPAMHFTQPQMASYASGETPPVHHRHRHHSG